MLWQTVLLALGLARFTLAEFVLADNYPIASFFDKFDFFNESDPTHGTVEYVEAQTAVSEGLVRTAGNSVYMGVDYSNVIPSGGGRPSVRLVSKNVYNHGLFILDLAHMPGGICGTWPAFWMVGPNWPYNGEIDIIEGANTQNQNDMTLHTGPNCSITDNGEFTGTMPSWLTDCNAAYGDYNGCQIQATATNSYGAGFNQAGGGVYATLWDSDAISIWFWSHSGTVPADIVSGEPDPTSWGEPLAMFQGGCNIDNSFKDMQIVFDTTFCGDWAGNTWSGTCSNLAPTCTDYVLNNPSAFTDAYWIINSLKVYEDYGTNSSSPHHPHHPLPPVGPASDEISHSVHVTLPPLQSFTLTTTTTIDLDPCLYYDSYPFDDDNDHYPSDDYPESYTLPASATLSAASNLPLADEPAASGNFPFSLSSSFSYSSSSSSSSSYPSSSASITSSPPSSSPTTHRTRPTRPLSCSSFTRTSGPSRGPHHSSALPTSELSNPSHHHHQHPPPLFPGVPHGGFPKGLPGDHPPFEFGNPGTQGPQNPQDPQDTQDDPRNPLQQEHDGPNNSGGDGGRAPGRSFYDMLRQYGQSNGHGPGHEQEGGQDEHGGWKPRIKSRKHRRHHGEKVHKS